MRGKVSTRCDAEVNLSFDRVMDVGVKGILR